MLSKDELKAISERTKIMTRDPFPTTLQTDVVALLADLKSLREIHTAEQRRSSERLENALAERDHLIDLYDHRPDS